MIVPSIDLQDGRTVQLIGGERKAIDAGDPLPIARKFRIAGEIAMIDLDAAMGKGSNAALIEAVLAEAPARVGGGIRDLATATRWLDAGAARIIIGTAARPELLSRLPRQRVIAALDARHGEVVVEGWKTGTGAKILDRIAELKAHVGGFLVTFVELEGRLGGTNLELAKEIVAAADGCRVTIAGGVTTADEIRALDEIGADAQVGMALYTGRLDLGDAIMAPLVSDRPDGLWPTVVVDERGVALGLVYSSRESMREAVRRGQGVYQSRSRGLWVKGETSGAVQELLRIDLDCDRDSPRFVVRQTGPGFCHLDTRSCWGEEGGLGGLSRLLAERRRQAPEGSYTARLFADPELLGAKLREEAQELTEASERDHVIHEAADVLYFTLARLAREGIDLAEVERHLDRRALKVTRRN
ncbi:MAG TPA: phosphoribosyl-ATP diphosphatase [Geminicoccaceae bacterium]|nr:phosphoribosyl-ATP diphosphatase [Geminicoccus sp.]HMU51009.1 phosphoribosyl-ATP diphosphatase [Geminicoccaceae bacterium]